MFCEAVDIGRGVKKEKYTAVGLKKRREDKIKLNKKSQRSVKSPAAKAEAIGFS